MQELILEEGHMARVVQQPQKLLHFLRPGRLVGNLIYDFNMNDMRSMIDDSLSGCLAATLRTAVHLSPAALMLRR